MDAKSRNTVQISVSGKMIDDVVITKTNLGFLTTASSKKLFAGD